ncbi:MAG: CNNM domain-containing protein [Planctomycetota bacterium]|nr:CNNM domain-containing protein [Planctomycetota bacterium]
MDVWWEAASLAFAMLILLVASGFFSGSETALFFLTRDDLRRMRAGRPTERMAASLMNDPDRLLTAVLFWNLVLNLAYFAVGVQISERLVSAKQTGMASLFSAGSLVVMILFGEAFPKSFAVVLRSSLAPLISVPMSLAVRALDPFTPWLKPVARRLRRALWPQIQNEPFLHIEDLERAVQASELTDDIVRQERAALQNILDMTETTIEEVMHPRGTYPMFRGAIHLDDLYGKVPHGDFLIVLGSDHQMPDRGVLLSGMSSLPERHLESLAQELIHIPWCANLAAALETLTNRNRKLASVVNEYGDTIGIVTLNDLIDHLFHTDPSRTRRVLDREPMLEIAPGRWHVEGITTLRYLSKKLNLAYEPDEEGQTTVAGLLQQELEHIPKVGEECTWNGYRIRVISSSPRGSLRVIIFKV